MNQNQCEQNVTIGFFVYLFALEHDCNRFVAKRSRWPIRSQQTKIKQHKFVNLNNKTN